MAGIAVSFDLTALPRRPSIPSQKDDELRIQTTHGGAEKAITIDNTGCPTGLLANAGATIIGNHFVAKASDKKGSLRARITPGTDGPGYSYQLALRPKSNSALWPWRTALASLEGNILTAEIALPIERSEYQNGIELESQLQINTGTGAFQPVPTVVDGSLILYEGADNAKVIVGPLALDDTPSQLKLTFPARWRDAFKSLKDGSARLTATINGKEQEFPLTIFGGAAPLRNEDTLSVQLKWADPRIVDSSAYKTFRGADQNITLNLKGSSVPDLKNSTIKLNKK